MYYVNRKSHEQKYSDNRKTPAGVSIAFLLAYLYFLFRVIQDYLEARVTELKQLSEEDRIASSFFRFGIPSFAVLVFLLIAATLVIQFIQDIARILQA